MPCYTRQTSTVEFAASTDIKLLGKALAALGYNVFLQHSTELRFDGAGVSGRFAGGKLTTSAVGTFDVNAVKRAYSAEVVKSAAQRFGWTVKQPADNQFQVTRRI